MSDLFDISNMFPFEVILSNGSSLFFPTEEKALAFLAAHPGAEMVDGETVDELSLRLGAMLI